MAKLLIVGGSIDPRLPMMEAEDRLLRKFLEGIGPADGTETGSADDLRYRFALPGPPCHPFKTRPVAHHRASQSSVFGLAELILRREAEEAGIQSRIMSIGDLVDSRGVLKDPSIFDEYSLLALSTTYLVPAWLFFLLRSIPGHVKIFLGGPGAYKLNRADLNRVPFHYLLRGEAEGRFGKLLAHALGGNVDLDSIPGLIWRTGKDLCDSTAPLAHIDLDTAPLPDFRDMAAAQEGRVLYESVRGCPFRCAFCDYPFLMGNREFRYKRAERIYEDWRTMNGSMGIRDILCLDSLFTHPRARLEGLCENLIRSGLGNRLRWGCYARPGDLADPAVPAMMRAAGCEYVYVGFESGSDRVLGFMNKRCSVEENRRAVLNCREAGIMTIGLFIAGFPGETEELFGETREFLRETPPFITSVVPWMPDFTPGSLVPVMGAESRERFEIRLENPSPRKVVLWRTCRGFRRPLGIPWGSYWTHRGMDLQGAWDCIGSVLQEIHEGRIRTLCEEYFLPRTLDDPLTLYGRLGPDRAVSFCHGLARLVMEDRRGDFDAWAEGIGLLRD
ncbi:MAG: radical SAM protein [Desulfobacteraceae bacterium]|nr:radical SAM protein [Desulfobacteraceae bacterium]